jgi:ADP-heptose:LPS heptosyltransferase
MQLLIVKLGSLGDIAYTLPSLAALRRAHPCVEISRVIERRASEIFRDNPLRNRLIEVDTKALRRWSVSGETLLAPRQQLRRLCASTFEAALDFQALLKSTATARLSGAKHLDGFVREPASHFWLIKTFRVPKQILDFAGERGRRVGVMKRTESMTVA